MALKQRTVYFREEDLALWQVIKNKAEWLHEHLNELNVAVGYDKVRAAQKAKEQAELTKETT